MEKQIQIIESGQDGPDNNLYKKVLNFLILKNDENQSVREVIEGKENLENILKTSSEKDSGCIINRVYEDNIDGLIEYLKAMEIKLEIIKYLSESNLITPMEYAEIIKELNSIIATSILGYLEKKLGKERYIQILIKIGHIKAEPEEAIKDTKELEKSSKNENNTGNTSNLGLILNTLYKLVSEAKTLFVDENNRLKYIGYILVFSITALAIGGGLYVINKNPKLFSSDVNGNKITVNGNNNSITINENDEKIDMLTMELKEFKKMLVELKQQLVSIPQANASEIYNENVNKVISITKSLNSIDKSKLTPQQKVKIEELNGSAKEGFKELIELGRLKNHPKAGIDEISSINKTESGTMIYSTMYPDINLGFSTYYNGNIGTFVEFIAPKNEIFLITCNNLVSGIDLKDVRPIYLSQNCNFEDVKYIQALFINKPINEYRIPGKYIIEMQKSFRLNLSDVTQHNCGELHCLQYNQKLGSNWLAFNVSMIDNKRLQYQIFPFENFNIKTINY